MAAHPLSIEDLYEAVLTFKECGTVQAAAQKLGMPAATLQSRLNAAKIRPPEMLKKNIEELTAEGYQVPAYSEFTRTIHGSPIWIKAKKAEADYHQGMLDAIKNIKRPRQIKAAPKLPQSDIIPWLQIGDAHVGMMASQDETGANFDIQIAKTELMACAGRLIDDLPECERMVVNDLGDGTHYENYKAMTEASGHAVDYDTRYWKMVDAYFDIIQFIVERAMGKAKVVDVLINQGNHSRTNDIVTAQLLKRIYPEDRVNVLCNRNVFIPYRMGNTLVVVHHGDKSRPEKFRDIVSSDYSKDWGETEFRYLDGGHVHHSQRKELAGCVFESWNNLAPRDKYAHDGGWRSKQYMSVVLRSKTYGEVGRHVMPIERVRDLILASGENHYVPPPQRAFNVDD